MNGAQVGIFEKTNKISFRCLLKCHNGRTLESQVSLEILSNFSHQPLEGQFSDEKFSALLVSSDFSKGDCSWTITMGFLDTSGCRGTFSCSFGSQLLTGSFSSGGFTGCLLGTSHCRLEVKRSKCFLNVFREKDKW